METTDKIAIGVLVIILSATFFTATPSTRYIFVGILVSYLLLYIAIKNSDKKREIEDSERYGWKDKEAYREAFSEDVEGIRREP